MNKSIAIFGEGPTEWFYIESLRIARRYPFKLRPSIPQHSDIKHMLSQAKKCLSEGYDEVVCLIDMDRLKNTPTELQAYLKAKKQTAFRKVTFVETDPCTEYWFLLHFVPQASRRSFANYEAVEKELRKHVDAQSFADQVTHITPQELHQHNEEADEERHEEERQKSLQHERIYALYSH